MADRVVFLRPDAERIARVVRAVENGNRDERTLRFGRVVSESRRVFQMGTFEDDWTRGETGSSAKTVTVAGGATVTVINRLADLENVGSGPRNCAIGRDRGVWYLIAAECD